MSPMFGDYDVHHGSRVLHCAESESVGGVGVSCESGCVSRRGTGGHSPDDDLRV